MQMTEKILFGLYVLAGPVTWLLVAYFTAIGRERVNKLKKNRDTLPAEPPLVSILIPAKDEGERIRDCVADVLKQDYPRYEVIAINDRSTDNTGDILEQAAGDANVFVTRHPDDAVEQFPPTRLRVLHIESLPQGWLGKCHALDHGAKHAAGEWLLFVDSDVRLQPHALRTLAANAIARQYDAVSILTTVETHTFVEKLMLPLLAASWMMMFSGDQTNEDSEPDKAVANGQVFLIRAETYRKVGGHAAVKDRIVEDVELMRLLKKNEAKCRLLNGSHLAATRMHTNLTQMFNGWARIFAGTARGSVWPMVLAIAFLMACVLSLIPALVGGLAANVTHFSYSSSSGASGFSQAYADVAFADASLYWLGAAAIHWLLMTIISGFIWFWSGNSPFYALLLPLSIPTEIAILLHAIRKAISGNIDWRGSAVNVRQTSRKTNPPSAV